MLPRLSWLSSTAAPLEEPEESSRQRRHSVWPRAAATCRGVSRSWRSEGEELEEQEEELEEELEKELEEEMEEELEEEMEEELEEEPEEEFERKPTSFLVSTLAPA